MAQALAQAGADVTLVGGFDGLAAAMVDGAVAEAGLQVSEPCAVRPAGIHPDAFDAALVDLYEVPEPEMCVLAAALPLATMAEASRCPEAGIHVDYHLDRDASESGPRALAGPTYAPVSAGFAGRGGSCRGEVRSVLLTLGGSALVRGLARPVFEAVTEAFPDAQITVAAGLPVPDGDRVVRLDPLARLVDHVASVDLAITGAGMTTLELACAGVPFLALVLVDNQARMVAGLRRHGLGRIADVRDGVDEQGLAETLRGLADADVRRELALTGTRLIDGRGAVRIAAGLLERWRLPVG